MFKIFTQLFLLFSLSPNSSETKFFFSDQESSTVQIVTEDWRPYSYEEDGEVKGIATEIVKKIMNHTNISYQINVYPWVRAYNMAQEEKNILIFALVRTQERENKFHWICKVAPSEPVKFYQKKSRTDISITGLDDIKKHKIGVVRKSDMHLFLERNNFRNIYTLSHVNQCYKQLADERVDLILDNESTILNEYTKITGNNLSEIESVYLAYELVPYFAAGKKIAPEILEQIQRAYADLKDQGVLN
jgi:polar amino acid transport system substrate-binding protein